MYHSSAPVRGEYPGNDDSARAEVVTRRDTGEPSVDELLQPFADLLDSVPDSEIAAIAGVTGDQMRAWRSRALPRVTLDKDAVDAWRRANPEMSAWKVTVDDTEVLVLAHDLLEAAELAERAGHGAARYIQPMARVL